MIMVVLFGEIAAASLFLMAIVPTSSNTVFVNVYHAVTAGIFLATASSYSLRLALTTSSDEGALGTVRLVCSLLAFGALAFMLFGGLYLYYVAAGKLQKHKAGALVLDAPAEYKVRQHLFLLACAQGAAGLGTAVTLATGAVETAKLSLSDATPGAIVFGVSLPVMLAITSVLYKMRPIAEPTAGSAKAVGASPAVNVQMVPAP